MAELRVLYLTGWTRSGSTMLGNVLGELPEVLHVGELHYLWRNGVLRDGTNSLCGCGDALVDCAVWSQVLAATGASAAVASAMASAQRSLLRTRHTKTRLAEARPGATAAPDVDEVVGRTVAVYGVLARLGGGRLIVDSSKCPAEAAALLRRREIDLRILHIVRDPRAAAFSYRVAKNYIGPMSPARSSAYWTAFNAASEEVGRCAPERYLRVRYEDLCRSPRSLVSDVMRFAGLDGEPPVDHDGTVLLGENHTVTGNPDRLRRGRAVIVDDERWRQGLSSYDTAVATMLALPFMGRYGYGLPAFGSRAAD